MINVRCQASGDVEVTLQGSGVRGRDHPQWKVEVSVRYGQDTIPDWWWWVLIVVIILILLWIFFGGSGRRRL
jgi:hypothetical protein